MSNVPDKINGESRRSRLLFISDPAGSEKSLLETKLRDALDKTELDIQRASFDDADTYFHQGPPIERMVLQFPLSNWNDVYSASDRILAYAREHGIYVAAVVPKNSADVHPQRLSALKKKVDNFVVDPPIRDELRQMVMGRKIISPRAYIEELASKPGVIFLVAGPTASGKTAVTNAVVDILQSQGLSAVDAIKHTTRRPRPGENEGIHYHFSPPGKRCFITYKHAGNTYGINRKYLHERGNLFITTNVRFAKDLVDAISKRKTNAHIVPILFYATEATLRHRLSERFAESRASFTEVDGRIKYAQEQMVELQKDATAFDFYRYVFQSEGAITGDFADKPEAKRTSIMDLASRVLEMIYHELGVVKHKGNDKRANDDAHHAYLDRISLALTGRHLNDLKTQDIYGSALHISEDLVRTYAQDKRLHPDDLIKASQAPIIGAARAYGVVSLFVRTPQGIDNPHHFVDVLEKKVSESCLTLPHDKMGYYHLFSPESAHGLVASTHPIADGMTYGLGDYVPREPDAAPRYLAISFIQDDGTIPSFRPLNRAEVLKLTERLGRQAAAHGKWARGI